MSLRRFVHAYLRLLRIWETRGGRNSGWIVELHGEPIAMLLNPIQQDMFWESYEIVPISTNESIRDSLFNEKFWADAEVLGLVWKSREFGDIVQAFPAITPFPSPGRLLMRGLYIVTRPRKAWDRLFMWVYSKITPHEN